jgi:hypothetical protein
LAVQRSSYGSNSRMTTTRLVQVKLPTAHDLRDMVPWVYWDKADQEHMQGICVDQDLFKKSTANVAGAVETFENLQLHLCCLLLQTPLPHSHCPFAEEGVLATDCFNFYVAYLLHKVRTPTFSDSNVCRSLQIGMLLFYRNKDMPVLVILLLLLFMPSLPSLCFKDGSSHCPCPVP